MALAATGIFQIQSTATAANVNAGYFNPGNANMATDGTVDSNTGNTSAPVFSSASCSATSADVGAKLYIKAGTDCYTDAWYPIVSVAGGKWTLGAAIGDANVRSNNRHFPSTVVGIASVGTPTGITWTIDYSQSDASPFAITDLASTDGTTNPSTVTSAAKPFTVAMTGNGLHPTAGTNWTKQWCEIVSVSGVTATLDKAAGSAATLSNGTAKVGGALSLGSSTASQTDDDVFELAVNDATACTRYFVKGGSSITYTLGVAVSMTAAGNVKHPLIIEAYASYRGDRPTGATRPTFNAGANGFVVNTDTYMQSFIITSTAALAWSGSTSSGLFDCKVDCTSETADRIAINSVSTGIFINTEAVSIRGTAFKTANSSYIDGCRFHDSKTGVDIAGNNFRMLNTIIECNSSKAIDITTAQASWGIISNCTLVGGVTPVGTGIAHVTGSQECSVRNSIIYGFVTGNTHADAQTKGHDDYNCYYNNTTDVTNWQKGAHDIAANPSFASVTERTGSTATTTAGNHLVQAGATFQTWGVQAGDYVNVKSGTGVTTGIYYIASVDSETQITTRETLAANATGDKVWAITTGRNFAPTNPSLKATASPGAFPAALTTSYPMMGAVQLYPAPYASIGSAMVKGVQ